MINVFDGKPATVLVTLALLAGGAGAKTHAAEPGAIAGPVLVHPRSSTDMQVHRLPTPTFRWGWFGVHPRPTFASQHGRQGAAFQWTFGGAY